MIFEVDQDVDVTCLDVVAAGDAPKDPRVARAAASSGVDDRSPVPPEPPTKDRVGQYTLGLGR